MTEKNCSVGETNYGLENTLRNLGEQDDDIKLIFERLRIRNENKNRKLNAELERVKNENDLLRNRSRGDSTQIHSVKPEIETENSRSELLAETLVNELRGEIAEVNSTLRKLQETQHSYENESNVSDSLDRLQEAIGRISWILCIGMAIVAPAAVLILVLTIWLAGTP